MDKDINLVHSQASKSEEVSSCRPHSASNSEKASSCRHDEVKQIKDQLTARIPSKLKIISIVGMGGIGKTTLAKSLYEDTEISYHFYLRAWITISPKYKGRNVLLGLLRSMDSLPDEVSELENEELAGVLYRSLKGRRYLIVLDDMWSTEMWKDFKWIFPNDSNGSRIILTSRLVEVAAYVDLGSPPHYMTCLSNEESWRLLCNEVFAGEPCPCDLMEIGKEIAKKCEGLPLAIVVVAGHLSKVDKNPVCWADVEKRLDSIITGNQEQILDVLCLSYDYLPQHLKACFLYMGNFPKNSEIRVQKLIRLWSALGFLPTECSENIEDVIEKCLEDLISRNVIMVRKKKHDSNGLAKTCSIHDLLWDLSVRKGRKEGHHIFALFSSRIETDSPLTFGSFRLLRVLDLESQFFSNFPNEITDLVGLRYLELSARGNIPESVSKLCNLETLINNNTGAGPILPREIWLLRRLRHLQVRICTFLPDASCVTSDSNCVSILPDLQTLTTLGFTSCTQQVFSSIPNLKRLKISDTNGKEDEKLFDFLNHLVYLHQLEKLNLHFSKEVRRQQEIPWCDFLSSSIKQLTLWGSNLPWENMNILAMLPTLEVLKLKNNAFKGPVYEQIVEGFPRLKVLLFDDLDLKQWIAETIHFPVLQHLVLRTCYFLEGIPYCFGEIPTLKSIELYACSRSAKESAKTIQQEQHRMENYDLQVWIYRRIKRLVFKLGFYDQKMKQNAIKNVFRLSGVESLSFDTEDKQFTVIGDIDPVQIAEALRKLCPVDIVSVGPAKVLENTKGV